MFLVSPPGTRVHIRKKLVGRATIKVKALTMSWDLVTKNLALEESGRSRFKSQPCCSPDSNPIFISSFSV